MNESNTTTTIPVTSLLHEVIKVTTEMARIMTNGTTMESHTELPTTTMTTAKTTTTTTMIPHTTPTPPATTQFSWNLTKTTVTPSVANATGKICSTTVSTTTVDPFDEFGPPEGVEYIFVPLGVMIFVIVLSAVVSLFFFPVESQFMKIIFRISGKFIQIFSFFNFMRNYKI